MLESAAADVGLVAQGWLWVMKPENADLVNGTFEVVGAVGVWLNVHIYLKHRVVHGVFWPMTIFYSLWGLWNLVYYSALHQSYSFYAGAVLTSGSILWVILVISDKIRRRGHALPPEATVPSTVTLET